MVRKGKLKGAEEADHVRRFIDVMAQTGSVPVAAERAGIAITTGYKWVRDRSFVARITQRRQHLIMSEGASIGYQCLVGIITDSVKAPDGRFVSFANPPAERRQAAAVLLRAAGHGDAMAAASLGEGDNRTLSDMTEDQLHEAIAQAHATLQQLRGPEAEMKASGARAAALL